MDCESLLKFGPEMLDLIARYHKNIRNRPVYPKVRPGFMEKHIRTEPPRFGESFEDIFSDIEKIIMPGLTHWASPFMHGYFPAICTTPSFLAEMLCAGLNCIGFTWASCPAATELEMHMMDWLGIMLDLPTQFLHRGLVGGGIIQTSVSEGTLVTMLAARRKGIDTYKLENYHIDNLTDAEINSKLVAYCSDQAHSSLMKNSIISLIQLRILPSDTETGGLRGITLSRAIEEDIIRGLVPFYVCATLGTTSICAFDHLDEIGAVCATYRLWLHVDAAYAGNAFICPEFRNKYFADRAMITSVIINPSKWLYICNDCACLWVNDATLLHDAFNVNPLYLQHEMSRKAIDFMDWQIPLSRRFRSLKLWFTLRHFGIDGLQKKIRNDVFLAKYFSSLLNLDERFEQPVEQQLGLVCFRLKGTNELNEVLLQQINAEGLIHFVPCEFNKTYLIRLSVNSGITTKDDLDFTWSIVLRWSDLLTTKLSEALPDIEEIDVKLIEVSKQSEKGSSRMSLSYGEDRSQVYRLNRDNVIQSPYSRSSLMLSNITGQRDSSGKAINGSFLATFDHEGAIDRFIKHVMNLINIHNTMDTTSTGARSIITSRLSAISAKTEPKKSISSTKSDWLKSRASINSENLRCRLNSIEEKLEALMEYIERRKRKAESNRERAEFIV